MHTIILHGCSFICFYVVFYYHNLTERPGLYTLGHFVASSALHYCVMYRKASLYSYSISCFTSAFPQGNWADIMAVPVTATFPPILTARTRVEGLLKWYTVYCTQCRLCTTVYFQSEVLKLFCIAIITSITPSKP